MKCISSFIAKGDMKEIDDMFKEQSKESPSRLSYNVFVSGRDTIKTSVITGLGTRLQLFQNEDLQKLTCASDIDLALPRKRALYLLYNYKWYELILWLYCITFLFIKLVKYADSRPDGRCENEVFFFLDEFANLRTNSWLL